MGIFEFLIAKLGGGLVAQTISYGVGGALLIIVGWILKKIPKGAIKARFGMLMYGLGVAFTLGGSQWCRKVGKKMGNKIYQAIEDYIFDFIEDVFVFGVGEFIRGGRSDNLTLKDSIKKQNTLTTKKKD